MSSTKNRPLDEVLAFISFETVSLDEIVRQKLLYALKNETINQKCLLSRFYEPVEKALMQTVLDFHSGNQIKASSILGVSRATLQKKMSLYKIHSKSRMRNVKSASFVGKELLVSSLKDLDLTEAVRRKFLFLQEKSRLQGDSLIQRFCSPIEKIIIEICLQNFKGNRVKTATALGINRSTLKKKMILYKISVTKKAVNG